MTLNKNLTLLYMTVEALDLNMEQTAKLNYEKKKLNSHKLKITREKFYLYKIEILKTTLRPKKLNLLQKIKVYKMFLKDNKKNQIDWEIAESFYDFQQYLKKFNYYAKKKGKNTEKNLNNLYAVKGLLLLEILLNETE